MDPDLCSGSSQTSEALVATELKDNSVVEMFDSGSSTISQA